MKNAKLKKLVKMMMLSAFLLMMGIGTASARGGNSSETLEPAQSKVHITGTVVDQTGEPVIGATVVEKGTANGIITDMDGKFALDIGNNAVLQISYIGYVTQEITVNNQTSLTVRLLEDTQVLDEAVVVGYGTMRKRDLKRQRKIFMKNQ